MSASTHLQRHSELDQNAGRDHAGASDTCTAMNSNGAACTNFFCETFREAAGGRNTEETRRQKLVTISAQADPARGGYALVAVSFPRAQSSSPIIVVLPARKRYEVLRNAANAARANLPERQANHVKLYGTTAGDGKRGHGI